MTRSPWRYACPHGHRDVYRRGQKGIWYCKTCNSQYDRVTDLRTDMQVNA